MRLPARIVSLALAASVAIARDQAPAGLYDGYSGFALPAEAVLPAQEMHPSLWFKAADLPALKAGLTADDFARTRWAALQRLADLEKPLPVAPAARDRTDVIHKYYGAMSIAARARAIMALLAEEATVRRARRQRGPVVLLRA